MSTTNDAPGAPKNADGTPPPNDWPLNPYKGPAMSDEEVEDNGWGERDAEEQEQHDQEEQEIVDAILRANPNMRKIANQPSKL